MKRPADQRLGEPWSRAQSLKNLGLYLSVRGALWLADRMPARGLLGLLRGIGKATARLAPQLLERARQRLSAALSPTAVHSSPIHSTALHCFERAGENLGFTLLLRRPKARPERWIAVSPEFHPTLRSQLEQGRGVVFVSAHLGPFEAIAVLLAQHGYRPAIVVRESYDSRLDALVDTHRKLHGVDTIHRGKPNAAWRIVKALRQGRPVGFLPDLGGRVASETVTFLGRPTLFPVGPVRIARRTGAPIVVSGIRRIHPHSHSAQAQDPRFELSVSPLQVPVHTGSERDALAALAKQLESVILASPEDWLWMGPSRKAE